VKGNSVLSAILGCFAGVPLKIHAGILSYPRPLFDTMQS
jgi:hypothetical protein